MKKILILSLISIFVVFASLFYVNYFLLSDSTIDIFSSKDRELTLKEEPTIIGYLPKNYSAPKFNAASNKAVFLANNLMYLWDLKQNSIENIKHQKFIKSVDFIDNEYIIYASNANDGININVLNISSNEDYLLDNLSYKNFLDMSNIRVVEGSLYFDIEYLKDGSKSSRTYVYTNNSLKRSEQYHTDIINSEVANDKYVYTTLGPKTFIDSNPFSYKGNSMYELIGADKDKTIYLLDKTKNNTILSLAINDTVDILEETTFEGISYNKIICSDGLYLVGSDFILDTSKGIKVNLQQTANILYIENNNIYYEHDGALMRHVY